MVSYNPVWKLLIDKGISRPQLYKACKIPSQTYTNMTQNKNVNLNTLEKVCEYLHCDFGDIITYIPDND